MIAISRYDSGANLNLFRLSIRNVEKLFGKKEADIAEQF